MQKCEAISTSRWNCAAWTLDTRMRIHRITRVRCDRSSKCENGKIHCTRKCAAIFLTRPAAPFTRDDKDRNKFVIDSFVSDAFDCNAHDVQRHKSFHFVMAQCHHWQCTRHTLQLVSVWLFNRPHSAWLRGYRASSKTLLNCSRIQPKSGRQYKFCAPTNDL